MELWGRIVGGFLLVLALAFALIAAAVAQARAASLAIAAICLAASVLGVPRVVRLFQQFTADDRLLESGVRGFAVVTALRPTGWRYNRRDPIVRFELRMGSGETQRVTIWQAVPPGMLQCLGLGARVGVCFDPSDPRRVRIDWRQPVEPAG